MYDTLKYFCALSEESQKEFMGCPQVFEQDAEKFFSLAQALDCNSANKISEFRVGRKATTLQRWRPPRFRRPCTLINTLVTQPMLQLRPNQTELGLMISKSIFNVDSKNVNKKFLHLGKKSEKKNFFRSDGGATFCLHSLFGIYIKN